MGNKNKNKPKQLNPYKDLFLFLTVGVVNSLALDVVGLSVKLS